MKKKSLSRWTKKKRTVHLETKNETDGVFFSSTRTCITCLLLDVFHTLYICVYICEYKFYICRCRVCREGVSEMEIDTHSMCEWEGMMNEWMWKGGPPLPKGRRNVYDVRSYQQKKKNVQNWMFCLPAIHIYPTTTTISTLEIKKNIFLLFRFFRGTHNSLISIFILSPLRTSLVPSLYHHSHHPSVRTYIKLLYMLKRTRRKK